MSGEQSTLLRRHCSMKMAMMTLKCCVVGFFLGAGGEWEGQNFNLSVVPVQVELADTSKWLKPSEPRDEQRGLKQAVQTDRQGLFFVCLCLVKQQALKEINQAEVLKRNKSFGLP